jgi:hypothetical protein
MTLAELLATPAHAEALARQVIVTVAIFGAAPRVYEPELIVELLTELLWDLAQRGGELADVPRLLDTGPVEVADALPLDADTRVALRAPEVGPQPGVWASAIDDLLRNGQLSEGIERDVAQHDPAVDDDEDDGDDDDGDDDPACWMVTAPERCQRPIMAMINHLGHYLRARRLGYRNVSKGARRVQHFEDGGRLHQGASLTPLP